jgi:hypothetical protein
VKKFLLVAAISLAAILSVGSTSAQAVGAHCTYSYTYPSTPSHGSVYWNEPWHQKCTLNGVVHIYLQRHLYTDPAGVFDTISQWDHVTTQVDADRSVFINAQDQNGVGGCNNNSNYRLRIIFTDENGTGQVRTSATTGQNAC